MRQSINLDIENDPLVHIKVQHPTNICKKCHIEKCLGFAYWQKCGKSEKIAGSNYAGIVYVMVFWFQRLKYENIYDV